MELMLFQVCSILKPITKSLYYVGGCVRDQLLGRNPNDYDIVVDGDLDVIEQALIDNGWTVKDVGKQFFVLIASKPIPDSKETFIIEVALFRRDGTYVDGRRPEYVNRGTIEDDANRRDFTINALYQDPFTDEILDPTGLGLKDLESKVLRFIGNPKDRLEEDSLRLIRMYRFASKLGFELDPTALRISRKHFKEFYAKLSPERVRLELEKLL